MNLSGLVTSNKWYQILPPRYILLRPRILTKISSWEKWKIRFKLLWICKSPINRIYPRQFSGAFNNPKLWWNFIILEGIFKKDTYSFTFLLPQAFFDLLFEILAIMMYCLPNVSQFYEVRHCVNVLYNSGHLHPLRWPRSPGCFPSCCLWSTSRWLAPCTQPSPWPASAASPSSPPSPRSRWG